MKKKLTLSKFFLLVFSGICVGIINGLFGGGGGIICVPILENVLKLDKKVAHATTLCVILPISFASSIIYLTKSSMNLVQLLYVSAGVFVGGIIGAVLLKKLNSKVVRFVFALVMLVAGIKMVI